MTLLQVGSAAFALVACLATSPASAQELTTTDQIAQRHFRTGVAYFDSGDVRSALREFEQAHRLSEEDLLLYNIAQCQFRMGDYELAVSTMERFLASDQSGTRRAEDEAVLEEWRARRDAVEPAAVAESESSVELETADEQSETSNASEEGERTGGPNTGAIVALAIGGAGFVTFGTFAALAIKEDSRLADSCGAEAGRACSSDDVSTLRVRNLVADIGLGVGVAGVAVGVLLLIVGRNNGDERVVVSPQVGPSYAGLRAGGTF